MRNPLVPGLLALLCASAPAQQKSLLFTGRFPFVSFDVVNERTGGSITELSEFAISYVTPGLGAFARTWVPAAAHQSFLGDPPSTNNYTYFRGFKTYFQRINVAGPFVKAADKAKGDPRLVYWTVRDQDTTLDIQLFTTNGTQVVALLPGDFVRLDNNGNLEYFVTQATIMKAAGPQTGSFASGASAICQDAMRNLYYSPAEGGHWITGNNYTAGPKFAFDGSIVKIPASAITYDARGNVQDVTANSAYMVFSETELGPNGGPSTRGMAGNAGTVDRDGITQPNPAIIANMVGLELDPNGGTLTAAWPVGDPPNQIFDTLPDFIFCADDGKWAGTIWSSALNSTMQIGSIAVINGIKCGSDTAGVPADGAWLGTVLDYGNFQPTLMGIALVDALPAPPFVADAPGFGGIDPMAPTLDLDFNVGAPGVGVFLLLNFAGFNALPGFNNPGFFPPALGLGGLPVSFGAGSWKDLFVLPNAINPTPISAFLAVSDPNGYVTFSVTNPSAPGAVGLTLLAHGVAISGPQVSLSNPVVLQFK